MSNYSDNFQNIKQDEKDNIKMNAIENQIKQTKKFCEEIQELKAKNLIFKNLLIAFLLSILKFSFNLLKFDLSLTEEIKKYQKIQPIDAKNKIITIGFYDAIHCDRKWRRIKKGYFYELPKYTNKFRWVFLAKDGVDSNCHKFTHLKFRKANNFRNLERAVVKNKIDIIVQNEDENLKEHEYLLELKRKYGTKLVQIMHEYYFFFLIEYGLVDNYNYKWKPLKNFDAIISSVPCQIYMYHLQQLNQSIYLPQYLPFDYGEIQPSKLETKNILMIGRISPEK